LLSFIVMPATTRVLWVPQSRPPVQDAGRLRTLVL